MEHHAPIIVETEKKVCFQNIALTINTIEELIHQWTISDKYLLHFGTTIMPLFSFTNIPWTPVITTLIQHQSCLLFSRPSNHQAILMYWDTKKQQGTDSSCATIVPLQNPLIVHIIKVKKSRTCHQQDFDLIEYSHYLQKRCLPNQQINSEDDCSSAM